MSFLGRREEQHRFIKTQYGAVNSKNMAQRTPVCKGHLNEQHDSGMEFRPSNSTPDWLCHVAKTTHVSEAQQRNASYRAFETCVNTVYRGQLIYLDSLDTPRFACPLRWGPLEGRRDRHRLGSPRGRRAVWEELCWGDGGPGAREGSGGPAGGRAGGGEALRAPSP